MKVTTTWTNNNPNTIYNQLAARLGRNPTNDECREECHRIMRGDPVPVNDEKGGATNYAIKTGKGYLATQGDEHWFQDKPNGWALFVNKEDAIEVGESHHSAIGTKLDEGYSIEAIPANDGKGGEA